MVPEQLPCPRCPQLLAPTGEATPCSSRQQGSLNPSSPCMSSSLRTMARCSSLLSAQCLYSVHCGTGHRRCLSTIPGWFASKWATQPNLTRGRKCAVAKNKQIRLPMTRDVDVTYVANKHWRGSRLERPLQKRDTFVGVYGVRSMAPEVLKQQEGYDLSADIWAFGMTSFEVIDRVARLLFSGPSLILGGRHSLMQSRLCSSPKATHTTQRRQTLR